MQPLPVGDLQHVLSHTANLWEEARGKSFFITGGTGFFGMWLLESFAFINDALGLCAHATILTRDPDAFALKAPHLASRTDLTFVTGDIRSFAFPEGDFAYVIHAGTTSGSPVEPLKMFDTIVQGTRRVLDFAVSHATRKFLFTSSGAVYGKQPSELTHIAEDYCGAPDTMEPSSAYGEGKRAAELLCSLVSQKHDFEAKIARCFAFVGPHLPLDSHFAIGNFLRDAMAGNPIRIGGDGTPYRSYLYASDLVIWLWTILFKGKSLRPYNVGSEEDFPISRLAAIVKQALGTAAPVITAVAARVGAQVSRYVPATSRTREELGLETLVPLADSLRRSYSWHHSHQFARYT